VKNLSHSASLHPGDKIAPSKPGIKHLELDALAPEPKPPKTPFLIMSEPTIEGLTRHFKLGYPSAGLFSSKGGQFIGGYAMSDEAKRRSAAALNAIWDDGKLERIRASEEPVMLPGRYLSVFLQAQPEVARLFLNDPVLQDIGLFSRFLVTEPETMMGSRPHRALTSSHEAAITAYNEKAVALLRRPLPYDDRGDGLKPPPLEMTADARDRWIAFSDGIDARLKPGSELFDVPGFASKLVDRYEDRAQSGASLIGRAGIMLMMERAMVRAFDAVLVESLDRLSRDVGDLDGLYKRFTHWGVRIETMHEGTTDRLKVGIRGIVGALYLQDLAQKVWCGKTGQGTRGKDCGRACLWI
jgi:hypothetical protein